MDNKKKPCTVYIDEAGDLGASKGTQWFILTAVIVDAEQEVKIREVLKVIKSKLNLQNIHFRNVKDFNKRAYIVGELSKCDFTCVHVLFDTNKLDKAKMPTDVLAYNYICRYLVERVSWYLRDSGWEGKIIFSSRGTSRDKELVDYIQSKLIPFESNQIAPVFTNVECRSASSWDMLQLADVCATSMFYAYETNGYGYNTPCFAKRLKNKLYKHGNSIHNYGIKFFSEDMEPNNADILAKQICYNT